MDVHTKYISTYNYVGHVNEFLARGGRPDKLSIVCIGSDRTGPDHCPVFSEVYKVTTFGGTDLYRDMGVGSTKKEAKNNAYYKIMLILEHSNKAAEQFVQQFAIKSIPFSKVETVMPPQKAKSIPILGIALKPIRKSNDPLKYTFKKCSYNLEEQEVTLMSQGLDCYRNYEDGDEELRHPDLPGVEDLTYIQYRDSLIRNSKRAIVKPKKFEPIPETTKDTQTQRFLIRFHTQLHWYIDEDDKCDEDFIDKYFLGPTALTNLGKKLRVLNQKDLEGGFNPYGNAQYSLEQFVCTKPGFNLADQTWTCFSTCLMPDPMHIIGTGISKTEAFEDWLVNCTSHFENWAPPESNSLLTELRKLPPPPKDSVLYQLWGEDPIKYFKCLVQQQSVSKTYRVINQKDKEGTTNPYGNGQGIDPDVFFDFYFGDDVIIIVDESSVILIGSFNPYGNGQSKRILTKNEYLTQNKASFSKLTPQQRLERWNKYKIKHSVGKNGQPKVRVVTKTQPGGAARVMPAAPRFTVGKMSDCAEGYLVALKCPAFFRDGQRPKCMDIKEPKELPCIPGPFMFKSRKHVAWVTGTLGIQSATSHGFIAMAPDRVGNNATAANNRACSVFASLSAPVSPLPSNTFPGMDDGTGGFASAAQAVNLNSDYQLAQLIVTTRKQGVKSRVVGAYIRWQYIGPALTEAGTAHMIIEPDHVSLSGYNVTDIGKFEGYFTRNIHKRYRDNEWDELTYSPVTPEENEFHQDPEANSAYATTNISDHYMGVLFTGLPAGENIRYECGAIFESIGNLVRGKTVNTVDPAGQAIVYNGISTDSQSQNDTGNKPLSRVIAEGKSEVSGMVSTIGNSVKESLSMGKEIMGMMKGVI